MQNVLTLESKKYAIKIENFEGPLDLLCHLIDKNKMSIYDIKLSDITDQYIEYINQMEQMNLEVTSEFLIMASTLLYLKSKNLLPSEVEDEKELTEEELLRRIIEYKKYKEISKKLKENYSIFSKRCYRIQEEIELPKQKLEKEYQKEIKYKIISKGISNNLVEDYVQNHEEELNEYEQKSAENIVLKKSVNMDETEIKQYLIKKGYTEEHIKNATQKIEE